MGMRTETLDEIEAFNKRTDLDEGEGTWSPVPQREVVLEPFEIDRHPVTAAQFESCWSSGGCRDERLEGFSGAGEERHCAASIFYDRAIRDWKRSAMESRSSYPMNCVARWEAEKYCASVGKRLPSADEWEYAARSGDESRDCAPGKRDVDCSVSHGGYGTDVWSARNPAVCMIANDTTAQGVCDFMHFDEWVTASSQHARGYECRTHDRPVRGSGYAAWDPGGCADADNRDMMVTFRCARGLEPSRLGDIDR
jgi:formylglycine-generating enzyme required for sulfatase activity